jgi:hypothetical protein
MKTWHWMALAGITVASIILQLFGPPNEHPHAWDVIPAFAAMFGFVGCILIIIISKALGKRWLQKREDYYDD